MRGHSYRSFTVGKTEEMSVKDVGKTEGMSVKNDGKGVSAKEKRNKVKRIPDSGC